MRVPEEMREIFRETGGLTPALWARVQRIFDPLSDTENTAAVQRGLNLSALRLEFFARQLRIEHGFQVSLLPPAGQEETVRAMEDRLVRQLWGQHGYLGVAAFCERFHIGRKALFRKLGGSSKVTGFGMARGRQVRYNLRQQSENTLKPAASGSRVHLSVDTSRRSLSVPPWSSPNQRPAKGRIA